MKNKNIKKHNIPEIISPYFLPGTGIAGKYHHNTELLSIEIRDGVLYGYMIDIINRASELVILAVGMTW
mgnify:CR=1 FL=1